MPAISRLLLFAIIYGNLSSIRLDNGIYSVYDVSIRTVTQYFHKRRIAQ